MIALKVLCDALSGTNQSPLNKAILNEGLAESVIMSIDDGVLQPTLMMKVQNIKKEEQTKVEQLIFSTLTQLSLQGLDHESIESILQSMEFSLREHDYGTYPSGLVYGFGMLESWIYGGHPENNLEVGTIFDHLHEKLKNGYFEKLIIEEILENPHRCQIYLEPSYTIGEEERRIEQNHLDSLSKSWSNHQKDELINQQKKLIDWQNTPNTKEQLKSLPMLSIEDIPTTVEKYPTVLKKINGIDLLFHPVTTNGILYLDLYFDVNNYSEDDLSALSFLSYILGELDTTQYDSEKLMKQKRKLCGNIYCELSVINHYEKPQSYTTKLCLTLSCFEKNIQEAVELAVEILCHTKFNDEKLVFDLLRQKKMELYQAIVMDGSNIAIGRVDAQINASGVAIECSEGFMYYQWLKRMEENWNYQELTEKFKTFLTEIITQNHLTIAVTGKETYCESITKILNNSIKKDVPRISKLSHITPLGKCNEGIKIPADVAFSARGGVLERKDGHLDLATHILSLEYLWNVIRVQGGAYGSGMSMRKNGLLTCYSYRDPQASLSLEAYLSCGSYLREFCDQQMDLTGYMIGTVSASSVLLSAHMLGKVADIAYFQGFSYEKRCQKRRELLSTNYEHLQTISHSIDAVLKQGGSCVIGGENQLKECKLDNIHTI